VVSWCWCWACCRPVCCAASTCTPFRPPMDFMDHPSLRESSRSTRRSKAKPMTLSRMAKDMPAAKKLKLLREREAERNQKIKEEVEGWFKVFDTNGDGKLQRDELRALLTHLNPHRPPTEENLDFLIQKATAIETYSMSLPGNKNGDITFHAARPTVMRYHEYARDQAYLDAVFARFDVDGNGTLDEEELRQLLEAVAPEGCDVDDADVQYVFESCDEDGDGVISREEVLPMISKWTQVAIGKREAALAEAPTAVAHRWGQLKQVAIATGQNVGQKITPLGTRLVSVVAGAKAEEKRKAAVQSKWRLAEKQALLTSSSSDTVGSNGEGNQPSRLARMIAAAKAEQAQEQAEKRAVEAEEHAADLELRVLAREIDARVDDSPVGSPRNLHAHSPLEATAAGAALSGGKPANAKKLSWVAEGAEDEEEVVVRWEEFKFTGPAGERCLMPIQGSSMDVLARKRRGSLDHVVPNLDALLHDEEDATAASASSPSADSSSAPKKRASVPRAPTVGRIELAPPPARSKPSSSMCTLL